MEKVKSKIKVRANTEQMVSRKSVEDYYRKQDAETKAVYCAYGFGIMIIIGVATAIAKMVF